MGLPAMSIPPSRRLGRRPPAADPRVPRLEAYLPADAAMPTGTISWAQEVASWPMCLNDRLGCCTIAGVAHAAQAVGVIGGCERIMTDAEVVSNYQRFGYVPGDASTDQGAVEEDVLNVWLNDGLTIGAAVDRIDAYATIRPAATGLARYALNAFGIVYVGVNMPLAAQSQQIWDAPAVLGADDQPGSWGGHCMLLITAEPDHDSDNLVTFVTWGMLQQATWRWWRTYCDEAHAVDHPDWSRPGGLLGLNRTALRRDMAALQN